MRKIIKGAGLALAFPLVASAASIQTILAETKSVLNFIIGLLFVLVTLYFIWGVIKYVMAAGDETKIKSGKQHMLWGIIGMAVIAGAWGLVRIILDYFGVSSGTGGITPPTGF